MASGCGSPNIATHFVLDSSGCATPFVSTYCYCVLDTAAGRRRRTICCSSKRILIQCMTVRMHSGWDRLPYPGKL